MKTLPAFALGTLLLWACGAASAQSGHMMEGAYWGRAWMGGYGAIWLPILLVAAGVGVVAWIIRRK